MVMKFLAALAPATPTFLPRLVFLPPHLPGAVVVGLPMRGKEILKTRCRLGLLSLAAAGSLWWLG